MPQHHLDQLSHALTQKGWKITATRSVEDFPYDDHAWTIERGSAQLEIHFDRFGPMGEDITLENSGYCEVAGHKHISLYFSKPSERWNSELASFLAVLDQVEASPS